MHHFRENITILNLMCFVPREGLKPKMNHRSQFCLQQDISEIICPYPTILGEEYEER